MLEYFISSLVYALSVFIAAKMVTSIKVRSYAGAVVFALVLGLLDGVLLKVLAFLTLPLIILTLGFGFLLLRALMFWLASRVVSSVEVPSFGSALAGSLVSCIINLILTSLLFHKGAFLLSC